MGTKSDLTVRVGAHQANALAAIAAAKGRTVHDVVFDAIDTHTRTVRDALNPGAKHTLDSVAEMVRQTVATRRMQVRILSGSPTDRHVMERCQSLV